MSSSPPAEASTGATEEPKDLLLCIFIHGFKGTDSTFGDFPSRLSHILESTINNVKTESIVFPAYETKGELHQATERFVDWLTTLTVEREVSQGRGGGAGKARIVLCSHSMGGLLAADACISLAKWRPDPAAPLWPNIIACISFDTPYLGLHPWVFKNTASKALGYVDAARSVASGFGFFNGKASAANPTQAQPAALITAPPPEPAAGGNSWTRFLTPAAGYTVGGVLLAGAAAGTAIYHRQDIQKSVNWAQDHMKYVGNLWNEKHLAERVNALMKLSRTKDEGGQGILFRNFYTLLPPKGRLHPQPRTFIILPKPEPASELDPANFFLAAVNNEADDEIAAHTGMFDPKTNDGYYQLGLGAVEIIRTALGEVPLPNAAVGNIVKREERSQHDIEEKHEEEANAQPSPGNHESPLQPQ